MTDYLKLATDMLEMSEEADTDANDAHTRTLEARFKQMAAELSAASQHYALLSIASDLRRIADLLDTLCASNVHDASDAALRITSVK